jgi:ferredoxin
VKAIYFDPKENIPIFCLHCGKCVDFCPHQCLAYE